MRKCFSYSLLLQHNIASSQIIFVSVSLFYTYLVLVDCGQPEEKSEAVGKTERGREREDKIA